ncbi:MAG: VTT domain-containing protein [Candidatus Saccharibacteria bacterium]
MFDVSHILQSGGLVGLVILAVILFAEVGLFLGFFLPGDTLLIAAGIYAKQGKLTLAAVIVVAALAAIAGDSTSYWIGRKLGHRVFTKDDGIIFRKDHINKAEKFYEKYGAKTLLVSHFLPVVRTFTPLLAGVATMTYHKFLTFNILGDISWAVSVTLVGYYVGSRIPGVDKYILLILGCIMIISIVPTLYHVVRLHLSKRSVQTDTTHK